MSAAPQTQIDWEALREVARSVRTRAYAPYSRFCVGAAAVADDGRVVTGCNVENAGYGVALCAECGLVSQLVATGGGKLVAFTCVGGPVGLATPAPIVMPCGRCRQLLSEHAAPGMVLETLSGFKSMDQVLPDAFGPGSMAQA